MAETRASDTRWIHSTVIADSDFYCDGSMTIAEQSTDVSGNYSTIVYNMSCKQGGLSFSGSPRRPAGIIVLTIDGKEVKRINMNLESGNGGYASASGSVRVPHNGDGSKTCNFSIEMVEVTGNFSGDTWRYSRQKNTGSIVCTTIPRASSGKWQSNGDLIGTEGTLTITRASTAFTHTVKYYLGSASGTIATKTTSTAVKWTPQIALCEQIPNATNRDGRIEIQTYNGDTLIGTSNVNIRLWVPAWIEPTLSAPKVDIVDGKLGKCLRYHSSVKITAVGAMGKYGSTIKEYHISGPALESTSQTGTSGVLNQAGTNTYTVTVKDSRGRSASKKVSVNVVDYFNPSVNIKAERCSSTGEVSNKGTFLKVLVNWNYASVDGLNGIENKSVSCNDGNSYDWTSGVSFVLNANVALDKQYDCAVSITDKVGNTAEAYVHINTASCAINVRQTRDGVAFGMFSDEPKTLKVVDDWMVIANVEKAFIKGKDGESTINLKTLLTSLNKIAKSGLYTTNVKTTLDELNKFI